MLLKKQTVWLLTMLSLVVVLSVYYVTSPPTDPASLTASESDEDDANLNEDAGTEENGEAMTEDEINIITEVTDDEMFTALRMDIQEERDKRLSDLTAIVAATDVSSTEKNKAYEEMKEIRELTEQEKILEAFIKDKGYSDVLVRNVGDQIKVTIKMNGSEHTKKEANNIMRMVREELGNDGTTVAVEFQPTSESE
ncbi:SpoIIIAH-like family protein [Bacillus spongiae]|uniref:SpoIIIAH-like family protein n=1 Tax=Bacillus spongiae TaxID=2683610 RepID=A0ABU8HFH9_9BACI